MDGQERHLKNASKNAWTMNCQNDVHKRSFTLIVGLQFGMTIQIGTQDGAIQQKTDV